MKNKIKFFAAFVLPPVVILTLALHVRNSKDRLAPVIGAPVLQLLSTWANAKYEDIGDESKLLAKISQIKSSRSLTKVQRDKLDLSVLQLIAAYRDGSCDAFMKARMPTTNWTFNPGLIDYCSKQYKLPKDKIIENKDAIFNQWWKDEESNDWVGFWNGASFEDRFNSIEIEYSPKETLQDYILTKQANAGVVSSSGLVIITPSLEQLIKIKKDVLCATVKFLPRSKDVVTYAVFYRLYWSPEDENWLPDNLVTAYSGKERKFTILW
jgi:hypothetical protein